jgi:D-alanine-D-alanine ligase
MKKVGIIFGGKSTEHNISVISGLSVIKNLNRQKYDIYPIYIDQKGNWYEYKKKIEDIQIVEEKIEEIRLIENEIQYLKRLDIIFPVLHGLYGEDGAIQGMLEMLDIKCAGPKILCSSICMDKIYAKIVFEKAGIPQADYIYIKVQKDKYMYIDEKFNEQNLKLEEIARTAEERLKLPVFVKPSNSGSSVGITKAKNKKEIMDAIKYASKFDEKILIEEQIVGREVECAILENGDIMASCVGEVLPAEDFYSYSAKYKNTDSKIVIPANIDKEKQDEIRKIAIRAFKAVDGIGLARVDFFIRECDKKIYINEINTMPGFTDISMYPKLWEASGIGYTELLDKILNLK